MGELKASQQAREYFDMLEEDLQKQLALAEKARAVKLDPFHRR